MSSSRTNTRKTFRYPVPVKIVSVSPATPSRGCSPEIATISGLLSGTLAGRRSASGFLTDFQRLFRIFDVERSSGVLVDSGIVSRQSFRRFDALLLVVVVVEIDSLAGVAEGIALVAIGIDFRQSSREFDANLWTRKSVGSAAVYSRSSRLIVEVEREG